MKHLFLYLAVGSILFTAFDSFLKDMTKADCQAGIELACVEVARW